MLFWEKKTISNIFSATSFQLLWRNDYMNPETIPDNIHFLELLAKSYTNFKQNACSLIIFHHSDKTEYLSTRDKKSSRIFIKITIYLYRSSYFKIKNLCNWYEWIYLRLKMFQLLKWKKPCIRRFQKSSQPVKILLQYLWLTFYFQFCFNFLIKFALIFN